MSKTPVSILQEMMVKKMIVPAYDLVHNGGGTHANSFTYRVICDELIASGTGRSKKEAKHEAATAMLRAIAEKTNYPQLPEPPVPSPVRTPLPPTVPEAPRIPPNTPFINSVGKLQELCADNNLQSPEYIQISDVGPPHARIFTIQCKVTTFKEFGIARTKKQAKQDAAKKLLDKLNDLVPDVHDIPDSNKIPLSEEHIKCIQNAKDRYPMLSKTSTTKKSNLGIKPAVFHEQLKNSFDTETLEQLINELESVIPPGYLENITATAVLDVRSKLENIMSNHSLCLLVNELKTIDPNIEAVFICINAAPDVVSFGFGDTLLKAEADATKKLIDTLLILLK